MEILPFLRHFNGLHVQLSSIFKIGPVLKREDVRSLTIFLYPDSFLHEGHSLGHDHNLLQIITLQKPCRVHSTGNKPGRGRR